jgi:pyrimidine operon attenuation protein/uracil phosphoribosyltransferase
LSAEHDLIMNERQIKRALVRIAHEILEHNSGPETLAIVGILTRGAHLAKRIAKQIRELEGVEVPVGLMDISLYRDDVHSKLEQPLVQRTDILFSLKDKNIILVDDVLFTGRTTRAALNHITDFGRPKTIQLAVLVDRGHRELPIKADYVGVNIPTAFDDQVVLEVVEKDGTDQVYVIRNRGKKSGDRKIETGKKKTATKATPAGKKGGKS